MPNGVQVDGKIMMLLYSYLSAQQLAFAQHPVKVPAAGFDRINPPGGTRLAHETEKTQSHEKSQFDGANPAALS
jgi:hypothetical protein